MQHDGANTDGDGHTNGETYVDTGFGQPDALSRLWAPYRSAYLAESPRSDREAPKRDPFVEAPQHSDEESLIIARGETVYALLNLYPYNAGHLMVIPYRKVANLEDLTDAEAYEMMDFARIATRVLKKVSAPDAINVGLNLGKAAGGSVGDHLHLHIVPRWTGDASFMTVISGTKVLPTVLSQTRQLLADGWKDIADAEH